MNLKDKYNLGINRSIPLFRLKTKIRMNKLKEINGKYYQECEVLMLATDDKAAPILSYLNNKSLQYFPNTYWSNSSLTKRHLYITSDEEIKEGDWFMSMFNGYPLHNVKGGFLEYPDVKGCKKIIATTDTSLKLPQPSSQFILKYIELYNAGTTIKWVNVEYEEYFESIIVPLSNFVDEEQLTTKYKLKVDKNNHITITKIKDSWTREEVIELCRSAHLHGEQGALNLHHQTFKQWIEENL